METESEYTIFDIVKGEKLSSVTFVMDYLQLDFDGNQFTLNIWPTVKVDNVHYKYGEQFYRDKLCSLIAKIIISITYSELQLLKLDFENGDSIQISLDLNNSGIMTPEIGVFTTADEKSYVI